MGPGSRPWRTHRRQETRRPPRARGRRRRTRDVPDPPVAQVVQVIDGQRHARVVVGDHRRDAAPIDRSVDEHEGDAGRDQLLDDRVTPAGRGEQQPVHLPFEHDRLVLAFLHFVVVGVREDQRVAALGQIRSRRRGPWAGRTGW